MTSERPLNVDALMKRIFEDYGRAWRSYEYKQGVRSVLEFRYHGRSPCLPEAPGSAEADAFLAGMEEGWALLARFPGLDTPQISVHDQHLWIEEQRARVIETLSFGVRASRNEAPLTHTLHVIHAVAQQLAPRPPRYPWEYATAETNNQNSDGRHSEVAGARLESGAEMPRAQGEGCRATSDREETRGERLGSGTT
jgi:hypothetical protein